MPASLRPTCVASANRRWASSIRSAASRWSNTPTNSAELLDALGIAEPIVLVGFSMGGYIAWQFVRKYAARLRALIQCDTRALADTDEARAGRLEMAENVAEWGSGRVAEMMGPKLFSPARWKRNPN